MSGDVRLPRGGKTGRSVAPRKTLYTGKGTPEMWKRFRERFVQFREEAGLTRRDVANKLGVSLARIQMLESGDSTPHPYDLVIYLEAIGVTDINVE